MVFKSKNQVYLEFKEDDQSLDLNRDSGLKNH